MTNQRELPLSPTQQPEARYEPLQFEKTFRIAVSGDVRVTATELRIIDTPEFQRLRGVRQLGAACQVYPTALHTRFDHSLGVLKSVDEMVTSIRENRFQIQSLQKNYEEESVDISDEQRVIARLFALLHDITHVPFGHTLEDELHIFPSHDGYQKDTKHPSMRRFLALCGEDRPIGKAIRKGLGEDIYRRFVNVALKGQTQSLPASGGSDEFIYFLVSDTVCADLLDYVKRDAYFSNLDINLSFRFLNFLYVADGDVGKRRVVVRLWKPRRHEPRRDLLTDLGALLEGRYMLAERIYFHPAKIIAGTILGRAVLEATLAGTLSEDDMLAHTDETLLYALRMQDSEGLPVEFKESAELSRSLALRYSARDLYRMKKYSAADFAAQRSVDQDKDPLEYAIKRLSDARERKQIEDDIAELAGVRPGEVLIYPASPNMNSKVAEVLVRWGGKKIKLSEIDDPILKGKLDLTRAAHNGLWFIGLMYPKALSDEEVTRVHNAFESKFLPGGDRRQKLVPLVQHLASTDEAWRDVPTKRMLEGCLRIAGKLADSSVPVHKDQSSKDYIRDLIGAEFANERPGSDTDENGAV